MNMEKQWFITKEKVYTYLKKFWWIIVTFSVIGIILFGVGIYKNKYTTDEVDVKYSQLLYPQMKGDSAEKAISVTTVSDNCTILMQLPSVQDEINSELKYLKLDEIEQWSNIEFSPKLNSNFLTIMLSSSEKNEKIEEEIKVILDVLNHHMEKYNAKYLLVQLSEIELTSLETGTKSMVELINILVLLGCICFGLFIVYLIMIFDSHVSDAKELEMMLGMKPEICLSSKEDELFNAWILSKKEQEGVVFVLGKGTEETEKQVHNFAKNIYCVKTEEKSYGEIIHHKLNSKKYLVVKALTTKYSEIDKIMQINQIYSTEFDGWVYIK